MINNRFDDYIKKSMVHIINSSYISWIQVCEQYPNHKQIMSDQIGLTSRGYYEYSKMDWLEKFKDEQMVLDSIMKSNEK